MQLLVSGIAGLAVLPCSKRVPAFACQHHFLGRANATLQVQIPKPAIRNYLVQRYDFKPWLGMGPTISFLVYC